MSVGKVTFLILPLLIVTTNVKYCLNSFRNLFRDIKYCEMLKHLRCLSGFPFFTRLGLSPHPPSPPLTARSGQFVRFGGQLNFPFS